jgi:Pentapeptide repeats (9 copies)
VVWSAWKRIGALVTHPRPQLSSLPRGQPSAAANALRPRVPSRIWTAFAPYGTMQRITSAQAVMRGRFAVAAGVAAVVLFPGTSAARQQTIPHREIERDLVAGRSVVEQGATIEGDVDLSAYATETKGSVGKIGGVFVCNGCTFDGSIVAHHVVFDRGIDLSASRIKCAVNMQGATFNDLARFRGTIFEQEARFSAAQFRSVARFSDATFNHTAFFGDAVFAAEVFFVGATFHAIGFTGTVFRSVSDFRRTLFNAGATFSEVSFLGRAEFSRAAFNGDAAFEGVRFGSDALFVEAGFLGSATFEYAAARGEIDLEEATLKESAQFNHVSVRSLPLEGIDYGSSSSKLQMTNGVVASDISLGLPEVRHLDAGDDVRRAILHTAEDTAKSAGNLSLANDLHYRLQNMASKGDVWPRRIVDHAFYRGVAGYFVVPFRPLYWLGGLVAVAAIIRWRFKGRKQEPGERLIVIEGHTHGRTGSWGAARRFRRAWRGFWSELEITPLRRSWLEFWNALEATVLRRERVANEPPPLRRLELTVYAVLLACFLLALANANPTLRDMVDAIV